MPSITLAIPEDLRSKMNRFPEINWSEVARQAIVEKTRVLEQMQTLMQGSRLSEDDAIQIGRKVKQKVLQKHRKAA